jgi:hypothetical protein
MRSSGFRLWAAEYVALRASPDSIRLRTIQSRLGSETGLLPNGFPYAFDADGLLSLRASITTTDSSFSSFNSRSTFFSRRSSREV